MQKRRNESKDGAAKQQRDQLWRNYATLAKINLFTEKYATVQIFIVVPKWPNIEKQDRQTSGHCA